ncbi:MAG: hypothetical protein HY040_13450 [Planctomycetes bacterium]|nr:hypothetical protein [Planctomycetota bacterium]
MPIRDDDHQSLDPREYPDPVDDANDDSAGYEDAGDDGPSQHPWWIILGVLLCLAVSLYWIWPG